MKKIGILTWYNHGNYGSALQAFALLRYIRVSGYEAEIISYTSWRRKVVQRIRPINLIKRSIKKLLARISGVISNKMHRYCDNFHYFYSKYYVFSSECDTLSIKKVANKYDAIIVGSDQVWSPASFDKAYLLNFCDSKNTRKIAYAPSIGLSKIPNELVNEYKSLLKDFSVVTVRENQASYLIQKLGLTKPSVVIDPTLLLDSSYYRSIMRPINILKKPFAFCYFLPSRINYIDRVVEYCKKQNLQMVGISKNSKDDYQWMTNVSWAGPLEFLWLIDNASVVLTNSYHGTLFSLLFQTPFFTFDRFENEDTKSENSRIEHIKELYELNSCILGITDSIPLEYNYDFNKFAQKLEEEREFSKTILFSALTTLK